ncbi:MAG: trimethylamine methyltransferase family protein [Ilumatobacter sp.]|uniref:trimethylamine methyltransferase family protein n=1 Tax=Ilumatobacter sp. TaxID=1967498 RepID=UPI0026247268|nr:trimethylamine methyltransferase family protein [Ilumatobacter sp.]MDJ0769109.1 trimethylamine methyltransferase family protein [Ilumatobacter sp.]
MARRGGGRAARVTERSAARPQAPAYIRRTLMPHDLVTPDGLDLIEAKADQILAEVGIDINEDVDRELFRAAGAAVDGQRVRFEPGHVKELVATAPSEFVQHARNPDKSVVLGGSNVVFAPAYGSPFVRDLAAGRRYASLEDFENFVKLTHASPWLHHSGGTICEPVDVPVNKRHLDMVYAHIRYNDQAFLGSVTAPERARDSVEMARILFGREFADEHCVIMGNVNVNSPLVWDNAMTGAIRAYAEANQGAVIVPFILGGAMGPVTLAGDIAQAHAETLVGVALAQLVRPGAPVIYGNFLSSMALRSGSPTFGTPEPAVGSLVVGQLARRVGLPLRCAGAFTASKVPDGQAMAESTMSMMSAILCGTNFLLHSAGWLEGGLAMGYEKFMMDADFCGALHRYLQGVSLDPDEFAIDGFHEVGPGKHFFGSQHTLRHYETAFYDSPTADNNSFEQWRDDGESRTEDRAAQRVAETLAAYEPPPLDESIDDALRDYIGAKKSSMDDMWY